MLCIGTGDSWELFPSLNLKEQKGESNFWNPIVGPQIGHVAFSKRVQPIHLPEQEEGRESRPSFPLASDWLKPEGR